MRIVKSLKVIFLLVALVAAFGCSSTIYDIEEVEEVVQAPEKPVDETALNEQEIKDELNSEPKSSDNKFSDRMVVAREFAIQIAAFSNEENATNFYNAAKSYLGEELYIKKVDGLYKIRSGNFNYMEDAFGTVAKFHNSGFEDAFLVELSYVKKIED